MSGGLILGLDGGGTGSRLAMATSDGKVMFRAKGPAIDPGAGRAWVASLTALLGTAKDRILRGAVLGLPYHGELTAVSQEQEAIAIRLLGQRVRVVNDVAAAAAGALAGRAGVLVLSGTGSMAWAIGPGGQARSGGFGDRFGDEGSAYVIGRTALQRTSWHIDGRAPAKALAEAVLERLGCAPETLIDWAYGPAGGRAGIAALARDVAALAEVGEPVALGIISEAADALAAQARAAAAQVGLGSDFVWTHAGGTFNSPALLAQVSRSMGRPPLPPRLPPLGGALLLAAQGAGFATGDAFLTNIARGLAAAPQPETTP